MSRPTIATYEKYVAIFLERGGTFQHMELENAICDGEMDGEMMMNSERHEFSAFLDGLIKAGVISGDGWATYTVNAVVMTDEDLATTAQKG